MLRGRFRGLGFKLFLSYLAVVAVGVVTLLLATDLVAPTLFAVHTAHMRGMDGTMGPGEVMDPTRALEFDQSLDDAFRAALTSALLIATAAAATAAAGVSILVTTRVVRPLGLLAAASRRLARGHYAERVPAMGDDELGDLATSFNTLAGALEATERRRLELIGDVAHELRTPIATLQGYVEGLMDGVVESDAPTWARLHAETMRLKRLVDDLQQLSRAEARQIPLDLTDVDPAEVVRAATERLQTQFAEKGLTLESDVPSGLPAVRADRDRAVQVLTNLLVNALRYTPAPGTTHVTLRVLDDAVYFMVQDSGIGIAAGDLPHVFERFYRVDKSRSRTAGGSGVGLTIARELVAAMGGQILAESAGPGQGATFGFTLPTAH